MHKSLFRWRLGAIVLLVCLMLAFNGVAIRAQDATDEPQPASSEPIESETPPPAPSDVPASPTEEPTLAPTEVVVTDTPTETLPPEPTEVVTEEASETPATDVPAETETPTVVAPVTAEPPLSLLVRELLDNGDFSPWLAGAGWSLVASEGGQALQVINSNEPIVLQKGAFYNLAVQSRFLFTTGSAQISVRKTAVGSYTASVNAAGLVTLERGDDIVATSSVAPAAPGTWRSLRLSAINDVLRVAVDDVEVIVYSDVAPLPPGDVSLSADFNPAAGDVNPTPEVQTLLADDFFLWVPLAELGLYPAPTQVAPVTPPPTAEIPTAVPTEIVVEPTEVVVVPTEEVTDVPATEAPVDTGELSGPYDDLTEVVGKDVGVVAPPTAQELAEAQDAPNDNFSARQTVTLNPSGFYTFSNGTVDATLEGSEPTPICGTGLNKTVWFTFTPATSGTYTFSTAGSSFDTIMAVYTDTTLAGLDPVGCNDDASATAITSQLALPLTGGTAYQIQVGGYNGRYGSINFRVQQGTVPASLPAPLLVSPTTAINSTESAPTFTWNKVANANSYEILIATNAAFTTGLQSAIVNSGTCATTCSYTTPAFASPATYYWKVRGRNLNDGNGTFSAARTFVYRTDPPVLKLPADNAVSTNSKPALSWNAYPGATYTVQIDDDPGFGSPLNSPTFFAPTPATALTFTPPTSLPQGDWYWRVRAIPTLGGPTNYSPSRKITINISSTPANNTIVKLVGAATTANVAFRWVAVPGATGYSVIIDDDPGFGSPLSAVTPSPATALTVTTALPAGVYYWFVEPQIFEPGTPPDPSIVRKVTVSPPAPAAPAVVNPPTGAFTNDTTPLLDWSDVTGAVSYDVQVCSTATCAATVYASDNVGISEYTPPVLSPGLYNWRVRSVNSVGVTSAYSAAKTFTVRTNILSAPADKLVTVDTTPTFSWLAINYPVTTPPVKYQLQVDNDSNFSSVDFEKSGLTTLTYTPTAAEALARDTWYWRVRISIDGGATYNTPVPANEYRTVYIVSSIPVAPTYPAIPAASAVLADTTPTLGVNTVNPPAGASWTVNGYEFQIAGNAAFSVNLLPTFNSPTNSFTASTLIPGTYYFRGRAITDGGAPGAWSAARLFKIRTDPPVLSAPANELVTTDTTPTFSWATFGTGSKYDIQIDNDPGFGSPVGGTTTNPSPLTTLNFTSTALTEGVWYWRVRAIDVQNTQTSYSAPRTLYVRVGAAPGVPTIVGPVSGFATNPQPTLVWNAVTGADHYQIQLANNATFTLGLVVADVPVDSPTVSYTTSGLTAGTWYWRVRTFNAAGIPGGFSAPVRNFVIDTDASTLTPKQNLPADNSSSTVKNPNFTWTKPTGAVKFELRYSLNYPTGYTPGAQLNTTGTVTQVVTTTSYKPPSPLIPGTYYWQVRAFDAANNPSPWTNLRTFKVTSASGDTPQPNRFGPSDPILLTWGPLSWVGPSGGYYEVQIDDNSNFSSPNFQRVGAPSATGGINYAEYTFNNQYGVLVPAGSLPTGLPNGTWYWRVRGYNPTTSAYGAYSSTGTFVVDK